MFGKEKTASIVAEFLGAGLLTLLVFSVQRSELGASAPYFVSLGAGIGIAALTFMFARFSGGHFNPAITLGFWTARRISTVRAIVYIVAQFVGAIAAYGIFRYFAGTHLPNVGGKFEGKILIAEAIGTGVFAFGFASAIGSRANTYGAKAAFIGASFAVGSLIASTHALGILNPAVALGIRSWVWGTYVLGPIIGAIVGINLYHMLFAGSDIAVVDSVIVEETVVVASTTSPTKKASKAPVRKTTVAKKKTTTRKK
jgi:aquaporin Z